MQIPSMPFKVLVFAPLRPQEKTFWGQEPVEVDKTNVDQVMEDMELSLYVPLPKNLCPAGGLTLGFQRLKDFHPDTIIANTPFLKNLREAIKFIEDSRFKGLSDEETCARLKSWPGLPIEIKVEPRRTNRTKSSPSSLIDDILNKVSLPDEGSGPSTEMQSCSSQIESLLRQILKQIFLDEDFRNLESVWRGLRFLLKQEGGNGEVRLGIVPVSLETLEETLNHLLPGLIQDLPSLIILDLPFDNSPRSLEILEKIASFSETLLVPAVGWITPKFFYLENWQDLPQLPFLPHYLEEPPFAKWRQLTKTSSGRWLAVTCNRFLVRFPYGTDNKPGLVQFEESENLWISPVWAVGNLIAQSFVKSGWPTRFTEWQRIRLDH
ncbi:MAG: type VI secretion system contractile sheath large subunit, partial [Deltaproteobacteria bacterium]|nr:type VI secretion system contractile sheath large subunit [Deltaproteobacteria bacterium]